MTVTEYQRYSARVRRYGFTPEEAFTIPKNKPLWMARIESDEGLSMVDIVKRERRVGVSDAMIAASYDIHKDTLGHWIRKWQKSGLLETRQ